MNVQGAIELTRALQEEYAERDANWLRLENSFGGDYAHYERRGTWVRPRGTLIPRRVKKMERPQAADEEVYNAIEPYVEQKRAMIAVPPTYWCPAPNPERSGRRYADRLEKAYRGMMLQSDEEVFWSNIGFCCPMWGGAVVIPWPFPDEKVVRLMVRTPRGFYPVKLDPFGRQLAMAVFVRKEWGRQAAQEFPRFKDEFKAEDEVEIIELWDQNYRVTITPEHPEPLDIMEHGLGFCPIVVVPNISRPNQILGDSDVWRLVVLQEMIQLRLRQEEKFLKLSIDPPLLIKEPKDMPNPIPRGPGVTYTTTAQGGAAFLDVPNFKYGWESSLARLFDLMDRQADAPSPLRGEFGGAVNSSKALNSLMGPLTARIGVRNGYIYSRVRTAMMNALRMQMAYWGSDEVTVWGRARGQNFVQSYKPNEFKDFHEVMLRVNSNGYLDVSQRQILDIQKLAAGTKSRRTAMEQDDTIEDVEEELRRLDEDRQRKLEDIYLQQMWMNSAMNAQPNIGGPLRDQRAMQAGMAAGPGAPQTPGMPMGQGPQISMNPAKQALQLPQQMSNMLALPTGNEQLIAVADAFRGCPTPLLGQVFLAGPIVTPEEDGEVIDVYLSQFSDKSALQNWMRRFTDIYKNILWHRGTPPEGVLYLEVTPGTQDLGYEPQGESPMTMEGFLGSPEEGNAQAPVEAQPPAPVG